MNEQLPAQLDEAVDLRAVSVSSSGFETDWDNWDEQRLRQVWALRSDVARVFGTPKDKSILPALRTALEKERNRIDFDLNKYPIYNLCHLAGELNDPAGVDTYLAISPRLSESEKTQAEIALESLTGNSFRESTDNSPPSAERIAQWNAWWANVREGYDFVKAREQAKTTAHRITSLELLKSKLAGLNRESWREQVRSFQIEWLDEEAPNRLDEIRKIAEDNSETDWLRRGAAEAYLHYVSQREADRWIAKMAVVHHPELVSSAVSIPDDPFSRMNPKRKRAIEKAAKKCLTTHGQYEYDAVVVLGKHAANAHFLAERLVSMRNIGARIITLNTLAAFEYRDAEVYALSLNDPSPQVQCSAIAAILGLGLQQSISPDAQARLQTVLKNPACVCLLADKAASGTIGNKSRIEWLQEARKHSESNPAMQVLVELKIFHALRKETGTDDARRTIMTSIVAGIDQWRTARGRAPIETLI